MRIAPNMTNGKQCIYKTRLAVVEADGIFEGRRRIRLPSNITKDNILDFKCKLLTELKINEFHDTDVSSKRLEMHIFDPNAEAFQELTSLKMIPVSGHCRIRLVEKKTQNDSSSELAQAEDQVLALPWKEFSVNLTDGSFLVNNRPLRILEVSNAGLGTGLNVWDGSIALTRYLESHAEEYVIGNTILEVGAGTGLVGIAAGMLGAKHVILTDLEYSMQNLTNNISINFENDSAGLPVEARVLDWHDPAAFGAWQSDRGKWTPDIILASDVVWIDSLVLPLVQTLSYICARAIKLHNPPPSILMSYQCRSKVVEELLFRCLSEYSFEMDQIPPRDVKSDRIQIFRIVFKQQKIT
jgi:hypothetical protein